MKMITFKEYVNHMRGNFPGYEDCNNFYQTVLDTYKSLQREDKSYFNDIHYIISLSPKDRLEYRTRMAEKGREFTPAQVDELVESLSYALNRAADAGLT